MKVEYRFAIEVRFVHPDHFLPTQEATQNILAQSMLNGLQALGMDNLVSATMRPLRRPMKKDTSE